LRTCTGVLLEQFGRDRTIHVIAPRACGRVRPTAAAGRPGTSGPRPLYWPRPTRPSSGRTFVPDRHVADDLLSARSSSMAVPMSAPQV